MKRRLIILVVCICLAFAGVAFAEGKLTKHEKAAFDVVEMIFTGGQYEVVMEIAIQVAIAGMAPEIEKELGVSLTPEQYSGLVQATADAMRAAFPVSMWVEEIYPIYAETFTTRELKDIAKFYKSKSGRKLLDSTAILSEKGEAAGGRIFQKNEQQFMEVFTARIGEIFQ